MGPRRSQAPHETLKLPDGPEVFRARSGASAPKLAELAVQLGHFLAKVRGVLEQLHNTTLCSTSGPLPSAVGALPARATAVAPPALSILEGRITEITGARAHACTQVRSRAARDPLGGEVILFLST